MHAILAEQYRPDVGACSHSTPYLSSRCRWSLEPSVVLGPPRLVSSWIPSSICCQPISPQPCKLLFLTTLRSPAPQQGVIPLGSWATTETVKMHVSLLRLLVVFLHVGADRFRWGDAQAHASYWRYCVPQYHSHLWDCSVTLRTDTWQPRSSVQHD